MSRMLAVFFSASLLLMQLQADLWTDIKQRFTSVEQQKPTVKVLLGEASLGAMVEVRGAYNVYDPLNGKKLSSRFMNKHAFMQPMKSGIKWAGEYPGVYQVMIQLDSPKGALLVDGVQYHGKLYVYQVEGKLNFVNEVDLDDYVRAVLPQKIHKGLSEETLDAMAVVMRTEGYYHALKNQERLWHVRAKDVEYEGAFYIARSEAVDRAIEETHYMVLLDRVAAAPIVAKWTMHSAGKTAPYQHIFGRKETGSSQGIATPIAKMDRKNSAWKYEITKEQLAKMVGFDAIASISLSKEPIAQKVYMLQLQSKNMRKNVTFLELQKALGKEKLRSNDFALSQEGEYFIFSGFGEGNGVGLCVYTAEEMAKEGKKASDMLNMFFPKTSLEVVEYVTPIEQSEQAPRAI